MMGTMPSRRATEKISFFREKPNSIEWLEQYVKSFAKEYGEETIRRVSNNVHKRATLCQQPRWPFPAPLVGHMWLFPSVFKLTYVKKNLHFHSLPSKWSITLLILTNVKCPYGQFKWFRMDGAHFISFLQFYWRACI